MSNRVPCKFFLNGACLKGDHCEFSHDCNDQLDNVCTFYQKGACSYGSLCRYKHIEARRNYPQPSTPATRATSSSSELVTSSGRPHHRECQTVFTCNQEQKICKPTTALSSRQPVWRVDCHEHSGLDYGNSSPSDQTAQNQTSQCPANLPICSFAAVGTCPYGKDCSQMHGDLCAFCEKQCLHPYRPSESGVHIKLCKKNSRRLEALRKSEEIECGVCLDRVLSKPTAAERRFGIMSNCDHSFCISCIRNWRSTSPTSGMDVNTTLRACPVCRKLSYYVVPSVTWYFSKQEKQEIIEGYKAKLKSIACMYFDFGKGTCPFGSICFYKHAYRDGRLEEENCMMRTTVQRLQTLGYRTYSADCMFREGPFTRSVVVGCKPIPNSFSPDKPRSSPFLTSQPFLYPERSSFKSSHSEARTSCQVGG